MVLIITRTDRGNADLKKYGPEEIGEYDMGLGKNIEGKNDYETGMYL